MSLSTINVEHGINAVGDALKVGAQIDDLAETLGSCYEKIVLNDLPGAIDAGLTTYAEIARQAECSDAKAKYTILAAQVYALGGMRADQVRTQVTDAFYAINKSGVEAILAALPDNASALEACTRLKAAIVAKGPDPKLAAKVEAENVKNGHAPTKPKGPGRPPASLNDRLRKVMEQAAEHGLTITRQDADAFINWLNGQVK